jgi:hypothetical protein
MLVFNQPLVPLLRGTGKNSMQKAKEKASLVVQVKNSKNG